MARNKRRRKPMPAITAEHSLHFRYKELQVNKRDFKQNYWAWKWKGNSQKNKASQWRDRKMYILTEHKNAKFQLLHHHTRTLAWNYAQPPPKKNPRRAVRAEVCSSKRKGETEQSHLDETASRRRNVSLLWDSLVQIRLASNSAFVRGLPWLSDPPVSTSPVLEFQTCIIIHFIWYGGLNPACHAC